MSKKEERAREKARELKDSFNDRAEEEGYRKMGHALDPDVRGMDEKEAEAFWDEMDKD